MPVAAVESRRWLHAWQPAAHAAALAARAERSNPIALLDAIQRRAVAGGACEARHVVACSDDTSRTLDMLVVLNVVDRFYAWLARTQGAPYGLEAPLSAEGDAEWHKRWNTYMTRVASGCCVLVVRGAYGTVDDAPSVAGLYATNTNIANTVTVRVTPHTFFIFMLRLRTSTSDTAPLVFVTK